MTKNEGGAVALILDPAADLKAGLATVLPDFAAALAADRCQVFAWHAKSAEYVLVSACGGGERLIGQFSCPIGKGLVP